MGNERLVLERLGVSMVDVVGNGGLPTFISYKVWPVELTVKVMFMTIVVSGFGSDLIAYEGTVLSNGSWSHVSIRNLRRGKGAD